MKVNFKTGVLFVCCGLLMILAVFLLDSDSAVFVRWWLAVLGLGIGFYPLSSMLFSTFSDRGWIFSKAIALALSGYLSFILITVKAARFTSVFISIVTAVLIAVCWLIYYFNKKNKNRFDKLKSNKADADINLILTEELIFIAVFLMWTYFAGFRPEAYGTEKFMDYGFMAAMMRDEALPARDIWYSSGTINYYYGGQYFAVFLTRLTGTRVNESYNIMRALAAAFAFAMPFSIVYHLVSDRKGRADKGRRKGKYLAGAAGILAGAAVSLAGNMHYVLYGLFGKLFKPSGYENYWFSSSTRYIGHNPPTNDECIHEFPSYSFVLGDLHAHLVNIIFVLTFIGILYAWFRRKDSDKDSRGYHIILLGFLTGMFRFTNYWDFAVYTVVALIAFALAAIRYKEDGYLKKLLFRIIVLLTVGFVSALPFTVNFDSMAQGIGLSVEHSAFYQLLILWGLPAAAVILLFFFTVKRNLDIKRKTGTGSYISNMSLSDMTAVLLGISAIGLVLTPELIYLRDIYGNGFSRANTMFKLTYQAYIMFGMAMIYSIFRLLCDVKKLFVRIIALVLIGLFALTMGYFPYSVYCWYGNVFDKTQYRGLDATRYIENVYPEDAEAIRWLDENIEGNPTVLEANGDSYTDWNRVSAMTGLPTVLGWFVHEWLWRSDPTDIALKNEDVRVIYTSEDENEVKALIDEYDIAYIFVGSCERESYPQLNEELIKSLGRIVYSSDAEASPTYIVAVEE